MIKRIVFVLMFVVVLTYLFSASIFSFYGMPESSSGRDVVGLGMGDTGIGNLLRQNSSLINPSLAVNSNYTVFSSAFSLGNITSEDTQSGNTFNSEQAFFPYFNLCVPINQHRIGFSYNAISSGIFSSELSTTVDGQEVTNVRKSDQTLYKTDVFYANKNKVLNFGVSLSYIFGHKIDYSKADFSDDTMIDTKYETEEVFKNPAVSVGFAKEINSDLSMGTVIALPAKLSGEKKLKSIVTNESQTSEDFEMPLKFSYGLAWRFMKNVNMAMDADYEMWDATETYGKAENTVRLGLGFEYEGNKDKDFSALSIPHRVGVSFKQLPLNSVNDETHTLTELSATYGLSIPIKQHDSRLDFALKLFSRDSDQSEYKENGFLITVGTVGFDIFKKPLNRKAHRDIPVPDDNE